MTYDRARAAAEFRRMMLWIIVAAFLLVAAALWYLSLDGPLTLHMVVATVAGVFASVLLGCGLFAAAFFSDKSGHDEEVSNVTRSKEDD
jgi:cytochrome c oxidase assembly factor CtaG